eukprot:8761446-Lingulodinium_polyedra.AAC.1
MGKSSVASQTSPGRPVHPAQGQPCKELEAEDPAKSTEQEKEELGSDSDVMPSAKDASDRPADGPGAGAGPCIPAAPVPVAATRRFRCRKDRSTVNSLADACHWPKDAIGELEDNEGVGVLRELIAAMADTTITTAYSGIDAPGTALNLVTASLAQRFPDERVAPPRHLSDTEWNKEAQLELLTMHAKDDSHLFGDIDSFFNANMQTSAKDLLKTPEIALEVMSPAIRSGHAVGTAAYCMRHGKRCQHPAGKIHVAGATCTAFSTRGLQRGAADPTIVHLLAWV